MARTTTVGARTTEVTARLVRIAAERSGQSVSEWASRALHEEALRQLGVAGRGPDRGSDP